MESEDSLIRRIARAVPSRFGGPKDELRLGIGDDSAILRQTAGMEWVVSCDGFLEGVHFLVRTHPAESVGYKALARATSDLAAMGAEPRFFLMSLALPVERTGRWLDGFLAGMGRAARQLGMRLAGGDTTRNDSVGVGITVLGQIASGQALTRSGARPGHLIYVSGKLGEAKLGLDLVLMGNANKREFARFSARHLYPHIRVELGRWLSRRRVASAAIDVSDGLSTDLTRLARATKVGARIHADRIPTVTVPEAIRRQLDGPVDPSEMALHGGDDYELLFTVPPARVRLLRSAPGSQQLTCIGETTRDRRIWLADVSGKAKLLKPGGWDPFVGRSRS